MGGGRAAERRSLLQRSGHSSLLVSVVGARLMRAKHGERGNSVVDEENKAGRSVLHLGSLGATPSMILLRD
jgi:hypothetical protein